MNLIKLIRLNRKLLVVFLIYCASLFIFAFIYNEQYVNNSDNFAFNSDVLKAQKEASKEPINFTKAQTQFFGAEDAMDKVAHVGMWHEKLLFSRPLRGLDFKFRIVIPAMNRWAIFDRPLRGLKAAASLARTSYFKRNQLLCFS